MRVVDVRVMRMVVDHCFVAMAMTVRLAPIPGKRVRVQMVRVVDVGMFVLQGLMCVLMRVHFRQVQPHTRSHQRGCG